MSYGLYDRNEDFIPRHQNADEKKFDVSTEQIKLMYDNPFSHKKWISYSEMFQM